jgi:hypothetical protein
MPTDNGFTGMVSIASTFSGFADTADQFLRSPMRPLLAC